MITEDNEQNSEQTPGPAAFWVGKMEWKEETGNRESEAITPCQILLLMLKPKEGPSWGVG